MNEFEMDNYEKIYDDIGEDKIFVNIVSVVM